MKNLQDLSVVVPLASRESAWRTLVGDLKRLPSGTEVLFVSPEDEPREDSQYIDFKYSRKWTRGEPTVRWVKSAVGRAVQLNQGARSTQKKFVWFLHSDCDVDDVAFAALDRSLDERPDHLHYFDLKFRGDGPKWMRLNEWGVKLRTRIFGIPFGNLKV
mgnify:CR=1 FL=1